MNCAKAERRREKNIYQCMICHQNDLEAPTGENHQTNLKENNLTEFNLNCLIEERVRGTG